MPQSFHDLDVWKIGYDLLMKVYDLTQNYPQEEKYALVQDTRRSANSIIANIAESHGRYYFKDKVRVLYISRGEIEETQSHLRVGSGRGYLGEFDFISINDKYLTLLIKLNQYIRYLIEQSIN